LRAITLLRFPLVRLSASIDLFRLVRRRKGAPVNDPIKPQDSARSKASTYFTHTEQRDKAVRQEIEKERAVQAAKTAKLRALRLAKEEADKQAQAASDAAKAELKANTRAPRKKRPIQPL
jgi:hypothetical protein